METMKTKGHPRVDTKGVQQKGRDMDNQIERTRESRKGQAKDFTMVNGMAEVTESYPPRKRGRLIAEYIRKKEIQDSERAEDKHSESNISLIADESSGDSLEIPTDPLTKTSWTVHELRHTKLPKQRWAIPGVVPIGLTFIGGLPKAGKSWLSLQIAHAVGVGGEVFGKKVKKRKVRYLALEDGPHRLKKRINEQNIPDDAKIRFETQWPKLEEGGIESIEEAIEEGDVLIIIDTLSRACGVDQIDATKILKILDPLQKLALSNNVSVLVNDHNSKASHLDVILKLYGSIAKSGVADAIYCLEHESGEVGAILRGRGRDVGVMSEDITIPLMWDAKRNCWNRIGSPLIPEHPRTRKGKVRKAIEELNREEKMATSTTIAKRIGLPQSNVQTVLKDLCAEKKVIRGEKYGREVPYRLP